jgi:hypothetical protein
VLGRDAVLRVAFERLDARAESPVVAARQADTASRVGWRSDRFRRRALRESVCERR